MNPSRNEALPAIPIARKIPTVDTLHGDPRQDDYHWFRRKDDPEVIAYLTAENAYADAFMKPTVVFQEALYKEMLARIKEDDQRSPTARASTSTTRVPSRASNTRSSAGGRGASTLPSR